MGISRVELLMVGFQVRLDSRNLHPQVTWKLKGGNALGEEIHADGAHDIGQPVPLLTRPYISADRQNGHGWQSVASQEWGSGGSGIGEQCRRECGGSRRLHGGWRGSPCGRELQLRWISERRTQRLAAPALIRL